MTVVTPIRKPTAARPTKQPRDHGLVTQLRVILRPENRIAVFWGLVFGGFVPLSVWHLIHVELTSTWYFDPRTLLVLGGLLYSAKTVFEWSTMVFRDVWKATGFVMLIEGIMSLSQSQWLSITALTILAVINFTAASYNLSRR